MGRFPKIGGPQYRRQNTLLLVIRTPKYRTPIFGKPLNPKPPHIPLSYNHIYNPYIPFKGTPNSGKPLNPRHRHGRAMSDGACGSSDSLL